MKPFRHVIAMFFCAIIPLTISPAFASQESQALVSQGRTTLFAPNATGGFAKENLPQAHQLFQDAVALDTNDKEAHLFLAVTQIMRLFLEKSPNQSINTLPDLLDAIGFDYDEHSPDTMPLGELSRLGDNAIPATDAPTGEETRAFLAASLVNAIDEAIAHLNIAGSGTPQEQADFKVILSTQDTGGLPLEIDHADILFARALLHAAKMGIQIATAYNLDFDLRDVASIMNNHVSLSRFLETFPDVLKLHASGASSLASAREACKTAITDYEAALAAISTETDSQIDDFFVFETQDDINFANIFLTHLNEIKDSLVKNRDATLQFITEQWTLTNQDGAQLRISIERDKNYNFDTGWIDGMGSNDFIAWGGEVESVVFNGNQVTFTTISTGYSGIYCQADNILATVTGSFTATYNGSTITNGTYTTTNHCPTPPNQGGGTFSGTVDTFTEDIPVDFNGLFGNTGRSPLNIRTSMPQFDPDGNIIQGTFAGSPPLNGIIPFFTTSRDLDIEMEAQPVGSFIIPTKTITIDGNTADWSGVSPAFTDLTGDEAQFWGQYGNQVNFTGMDIQRLYIAKDASFYYFRLDLADGMGQTAENTTPVYTVSFNSGQPYFGVSIADPLNSKVTTWRGPFSEGTTYTNGVIASSNSSVEWKVPFADLPINQSYNRLAVDSVRNGGSNNNDGSNTWVIDSNLTNIRLNTATISGTISCQPSCNGGGNIYIRSSSWHTNPQAAFTYSAETTFITQAGGYSLPYQFLDSSQYIHAYWDADGDGRLSPGDLAGTTGPVTVQASGNTVNITLNTQIDNTYVTVEPGAYRVYGSNSFQMPGYATLFKYMPWGNDWTYLGEATTTQTFSANQYYKNLLITWNGDTPFFFDSVEDTTANTAIGVNADNSSAGSSVTSYGIFNSYNGWPDYWSTPTHINGRNDQNYAMTAEGSPGYIAFTMPDDSAGASTSRQLKITAYADNGTDSDGDQLPDFWEIKFGLNPLDNTDAAVDSDQDTISNLNEYNNHTSPINADSDWDGTPDSTDLFPLDITEQTDIDGDGYGSIRDIDDDNDGLLDTVDQLPNGQAIYPPPVIDYANAQSISNEGQAPKTKFMARISGPGLSDIASFTVSGPEGVFSLAADGSFKDRGLFFSYTLNTQAKAGTYTFTLTDRQGRSASVSKYYEHRTILPVVDAASMLPADQTYTGTTNVTFSFTRPDPNLYYQVIVFTPGVSYPVLFYVSPVQKSGSFQVPSGVLEPNSTYYWIARTFDSAVDPQNFTQSARGSFFTGTKGYASARYAMKSFYMGGSYRMSILATDCNVANWDVAEFKVTFPDNQTVVNLDFSTMPRLNDPAWHFAQLQSLTPFPNGTYTLTLTDTDGNQSYTYISFIHSNIPSIDNTTRSPADNAYLNSNELHFSWLPPDNGTYIYFVRIYDHKKGFHWYQTQASPATSATIPADILPPGDSYYWAVFAMDQNNNLVASSSRFFTIISRSNLTDSDGDGIADSQDEFPNDKTEWVDHDKDGTGNNADLDDDNDGIPDSSDAMPFDTDNDGIPNGADPDDDNDGMPDSWEIDNGLNPLDAADAAGDTDNDGVSNFDEFLSGTDPRIKNLAISGRVFANNSPASGIWVEAISPSTQAYYGTNTNPDGSYLIKVSPASDYLVVVWQHGEYKIVFYNNAGKWAEANRLNLTTNSAIDIDFNLLAGVEISGTVSGLLSGDKVMIEAWSEKTQGWAGKELTGNGNSLAYTLTGLAPADDYRIRVWADGYKGGYVSDSDATADGQNTNIGTWEEAELIIAKGGITSVNVNLVKGRTISGTLTNLTNGDLVSIYAQSQSTGNWGSTWVRSNGTEADYTIAGLAQADDYVVSVSSSGYINGYYSGTPGEAPVAYTLAAKVNTTTSHANGIDMAMQAGRTISGTLSGLRSGDYAYVQAWSPTSGVSAYKSVIGTGGDITYDIVGLSSASDYRIYVNANNYVGGYYSSSGTVTQKDADPVNTISGDVNGIDLTVYVGKSISGTITGLDKNEWARIDAWSSSTWAWGGTSVVGNGGDVSYTIEGLISSNDYTVSFQPNNHAKETKTGISSATNPTNVNFIAQASNSISGTISGAGGRAQINIEARSPSTNDWGRAYVSTDANGNANYVIKSLGDANDYRVSAVKGQTKLFYSDQGTTADWNQATFVDLSNGSVTGKDINFTSFLTYTLSGSISGLNNNERVWIDAWDESSWMLGGGEVVGNGNFSLDLLSGNYKLGLYADGYLYTYYAATDTVTTAPDAAGVIDLTGSSQNVGQMALAPASSISGTLYDKDANPLSGIFVEVTGTNDPNFNAGATTETDGSYLIVGLPDDTYTVKIFSSQGSYTGQVTISGSDLTGQDITIGAVNNSTGAVSGTASKEGALVAGAIVILTDADGLFVNATYTETNGQFSFSGLSVGSYKVSADFDGNGTTDGSCTKTVPANAVEHCPILFGVDATE